MTAQAIDMPPRSSSILRFLKGVALLRESVVGMIGASIVLFWILVALSADLIAPFPPNANLVVLAFRTGLARLAGPETDP